MNNIIYALVRLSRRPIASTGLVEICYRMRSQFILLHYFIDVILKNVIEAICIRDRTPSPQHKPFQLIWLIHDKLIEILFHISPPPPSSLSVYLYLSLTRQRSI